MVISLWFNHIKVVIIWELNVNTLLTTMYYIKSTAVSSGDANMFQLSDKQVA